jgi:hypothetical protein
MNYRHSTNTNQQVWAKITEKDNSFDTGSREAKIYIDNKDED